MKPKKQTPKIVEVLFQAMTDDTGAVTYQVSARRGAMGETPQQYVVHQGKDPSAAVIAANTFVRRTVHFEDNVFDDLERRRVEAEKGKPA